MFALEVLCSICRYFRGFRRNIDFILHIVNCCRHIKTKIARQIRTLHANTAFEAHQSTMFKRVFAHNLDHKKNWYAYNKSLLGYQNNRNPEGSKTFKCFPSEVKRVKLEDLRDDEGRQVSHYRIAGVKSNVEDVFVISTLGIVVLSLRNNCEGWLQSSLGSYMGSYINSAVLDNLEKSSRKAGPQYR